MWFIGGKQYVSAKKADIAVAWQSVAVMIAVALSAKAVMDGEWLGLLCAVGVIALEVRSIRRILTARGSST
jgi:hypothetical protein